MAISHDQYFLKLNFQIKLQLQNSKKNIIKFLIWHYKNILHIKYGNIPLKSSHIVFILFMQFQWHFIAWFIFKSYFSFCSQITSKIFRSKIEEFNLKQRKLGHSDYFDATELIFKFSKRFLIFITNLTSKIQNQNKTMSKSDSGEIDNKKKKMKSINEHSCAARSPQSKKMEKEISEQNEAYKPLKRKQKHRQFRNPQNKQKQAERLDENQIKYSGSLGYKRVKKSDDSQKEETKTKKIQIQNDHTQPDRDLLIEKIQELKKISLELQGMCKPPTASERIDNLNAWLNQTTQIDQIHRMNQQFVDQMSEKFVILNHSVQQIKKKSEIMEQQLHIHKNKDQIRQNQAKRKRNSKAKPEQNYFRGKRSLFDLSREMSQQAFQQSNQKKKQLMRQKYAQNSNLINEKGRKNLQKHQKFQQKKNQQPDKQQKIESSQPQHEVFYQKIMPMAERLLSFTRLRQNSRERIANEPLPDPEPERELSFFEKLFKNFKNSKFIGGLLFFILILISYVGELLTIEDAVQIGSNIEIVDIYK